MKFMNIIFSIIFLFLSCLPAHSWIIYNSGGSTDADTLDGLDSTAFTLNSSFATYTSTAGNGGGNSFTNISVSDEAYLNEISGYDIMLQGVFGSGTSLDVGGAGTRCFFYPKKAAWRCGAVTGNQWDEGSMGDYSVAHGADTKAIALFSYAEGWGTSALQAASHAEGQDTIAGGGNSHAEGYLTQANGGISHAEGDETLASGTSSHAQGRLTTASGLYSHAEGLFGIAAGQSSHVGGNRSMAKAAKSFVHGSYLNISSSATNSIMFGSYANATERDANKLTTSNTMKLANMDLVVEGGVVYSGMTTVMGDYSTVLKDYAVFGNATSTSIDVYLQDAFLAEGQIKRIIKDDSTSNTVTLQPYSTQTISHATNYILRDHNSEILIMSRGGNWDRMQATPVSFYADMHLHDNSTSTIINTQNIPHFVQGLFTDDDSNGFTFSAGSSGALTVFADYSATVPGAVLATDVSHGLSTGDTIGITATTNYNGAFNVTVAGSDNFYFTDTFVADDATGTWYQGDRYSVDPGAGSKYRIGWHCFGSPDSGGGANFEFELFINEAPIEKAESVSTFANSTDIEMLGGGGLIDLVDGDVLSFAIINMTDTVNFTAMHCNIGLDNI